MAQTRRTATATKRNAARNTTAYRNESAYIYDNTARSLEVKRQLEEPPRRKLSNEARKNREKAHHMNFGYLTFLAVALFLFGAILINYVELRAELTNRTKYLAKLESDLNRIRQENDEELVRIESSIDLEEIRRIAIGELGMMYAQEGQIIDYSAQENDYMRKVLGGD